MSKICTIVSALCFMFSRPLIYTSNSSFPVLPFSFCLMTMVAADGEWKQWMRSLIVCSKGLKVSKDDVIGLNSPALVQIHTNTVPA